MTSIILPVFPKVSLSFFQECHPDTVLFNFFGHDQKAPLPVWSPVMSRTGMVPIAMIGTVTVVFVSAIVTMLSITVRIAMATVVIT